MGAREAALWVRAEVVAVGVTGVAVVASNPPAVLVAAHSTVLPV